MRENFTRENACILRKKLWGIRYGIQQHLIFVSVFAHNNDIVLFGSREDEKHPPSLRESYFLCMGGAGIRSADVFFYDFRLSPWQDYRKSQK